MNFQEYQTQIREKAKREYNELCDVLIPEALHKRIELKGSMEAMYWHNRLEERRKLRDELDEKYNFSKEKN